MEDQCLIKILKAFDDGHEPVLQAWLPISLLGPSLAPWNAYAHSVSLQTSRTPVHKKYHLSLLSRALTNRQCRLKKPFSDEHFNHSNKDIRTIFPLEMRDHGKTSIYTNYTNKRLLQQVVRIVPFSGVLTVVSNGLSICS